MSTTITGEQFFEAMAKISPALPGQIQALLQDLEPLGVYPEFKASLNFRWDPPTGKSLNLGYIMKNGKLWTDAGGWFMPKPLVHSYIEDLAQAFEIGVAKPASGNCYVTIDGKAPRVDMIADKFKRWPAVIERFQGRVRDYRSQIEGEA